MTSQKTHGSKSSSHRKALIIATAVLTVAAVAQMAMVYFGGYVIAKSDVPLNYPMAEFSDRVSPRFVLAREINQDGFALGKAQLTSDVVETLGTEDFISWIYVDRKNSDEKSRTYVRFHLAYYTALLDAVPHVPDNCMLAGGMLPDPDKSGEITWKLPSAPSGWEDWSSFQLRRSSFVSAEKPDGPGVTAFYVFSANGKPMWNRRSVRMAMSKPWEKYCYYLKIELMAFRAGSSISSEESEAVCRDFFIDASDEIFKLLLSADQLGEMEKQD